MRRAPFFKSVHFKLLTAMSGLLIFNSLFSGMLHLRFVRNINQDLVRQQDDYWRDFLFKEFSSWSHTLKFNVELNIGKPGFGTTPVRLGNLISNNTEVVYAMVTDRQGINHVLQQKQSVILAEVPSPADRTIALATNPFHVVYSIGAGGSGVVEFVEPLNYLGRHWGVFRLGFTLARLDDVQVATRQNMLQVIPRLIKRDVLAVGITIIISFGLILWLASRFTRPLEALSGLTVDIAKGNFGSAEKLSVGSDDEIGTLSHAFMQMARQLDQFQHAQGQVIVQALQSETFLKSILENIPDMVFLKDAETLSFRYMNSAGEALVGFELKSLLGRTDYDFFPRAEADLFTRKDREALAGGRLVDIPEEPIMTRDGQLRYLHTKKIPICDDHGKPIYLLGISRDVTEIKRARDNEQHFFVNAPDMLCVVGFDGLIELANPAFQRQLGYSARELIGLHYLSFVHPDDQPDVEEQFNGVMQDGAGLVMHTFRCHSKDGGYRWLKWTANADVLYRRIYAVARDITEQVELETMIVEVATKEQERIAHDLHDSLGQTLTGLALKAKLLERTAKDAPPDQVDSLRQIIWLANHASEQARAIARGMDPVVLEEGLAPALQDLAKSASEAFDTKCVFFKDPKVTVSDKRVASQLYRIAQESVNNAIRHGRSTHVLVRLFLAGGRIVLAIEDDGIGLSGDGNVTNGVGIRNMKYRAQTIGGKLEIGANAKGGVTVKCTVRHHDAEHVAASETATVRQENVSAPEESTGGQ